MALRNLQPAKGKTVASFEPVTSNLTNLDTLTFLNGFFSVAGNLVTVTAAFTTNPTSAVALFSFEMSLPFGIDVTAVADIIGVAGNGNGPEFGGSVIGSIANDTALATSMHEEADAITTISFSYVVE